MTGKGPALPGELDADAWASRFVSQNCTYDLKQQDMSKFILLVLLILSSPVFADRFDYFDINNPTVRISIRSESNEFVLNDVAFDATFYPKKDALICVKSRGFQLAVPRSLKTDNSWIFEGVTYKSIKQFDTSIMGKQGPFWLIEQQSDHPLWFVYSQASGLIMLGGLNQTGGSIFVLVQSCGFGASVDCSH